MNTPTYKCVIFDLDGTLLYTLLSLNKAINEALGICGYPTHSVERMVDFVNFGSVELVRRALPEDKRYDEEVMRVHDIYFPILKKYASDGTKPYDGIPEVCKKLKESGITLCVMSNKPQAATENCISTYFEDGLFDIVRGSVPGKYIKPDAAFTNEVIESSGFDRSECILVGDSIVDMQTAANADCPLIWVKWGYGTKENIGGEPAYTAEKPEDLLSIIL